MEASIVEVLPAETEPQKKRYQVSDIIDLSISNARVASHLKFHLSDANTENQLKELRKQLKDDPNNIEIKTKIVELAQTQIRVSNDCPVAIASGLNWAILKLLNDVYDQTIVAGHKMVEVSYIHSGNYQKKVWYPFFRSTQSFLTYDPIFEEELKKIRAAENKKIKEAREIKKKVILPPISDVEPSINTTFATYVDDLLKVVKNSNERFKTLRVSKRIRDVISNYVKEFIEIINKRAKLLLHHKGVSPVDARTFNAKQSLYLMCDFMIVENCSKEDIDEFIEYVKEKLDKYHQYHIESSLEKKSEPISAEKLAERAARAIKVAQEKAARAAKKAEELASQAEQLLSDSDFTNLISEQ
jgi:histone H3/H4